MSYTNPTPLRIGATGNLAGKSYRVVGRVVMGVVDDGETYYWNEFNLEADGGSSADLVYEETERGGEWRLFTLFEPDAPMTAADAATKRVGDPVNLDGDDVRVTFVDTSRIYYIEGKAPEGEEVGDVANYFNAEAGNIMDVVSWTGEDVEYYHGKNLSPRDVENAFNLQLPAAAFTESNFNWNKDSDGDQKNWSSYIWLIVVLLPFLLIFGGNFSCPTTLRNPMTRVAAPAAPLTVGATGTWRDKHYKITAHALVEIAEVNVVYERHEYQLTDDDGKIALLVCDNGPDTKDWYWFTPLDFSPPILPEDAGSRKLGDPVYVDMITAVVNRLFQSTVRQVEALGVTDWQSNRTLYGYQAVYPNGVVLARWSQFVTTVHQGTTVSAKDVTAAFPSPAK